MSGRGGFTQDSLVNYAKLFCCKKAHNYQFPTEDFPKELGNLDLTFQILQLDFWFWSWFWIFETLWVSLRV